MDLNDKLLLWLRCQKLKPEDESHRSFPTQLNDMISVMVSYNNALSVQLQWMLKVMEIEELRGDSDETTDYYVWGRYVSDCNLSKGRLCNRRHFE